MLTSSSVNLPVSDGVVFYITRSLASSRSSGCYLPNHREMAAVFPLSSPPPPLQVLPRLATIPRSHRRKRLASSLPTYTFRRKRQQHPPAEEKKHPFSSLSIPPPPPKPPPRLARLAHASKFWTFQVAYYRHDPRSTPAEAKQGAPASDHGGDAASHLLYGEFHR